MVPSVNSFMFAPSCVTDICSHGIGQRGYGGGLAVDGGRTGSVKIQAMGKGFSVSCCPTSTGPVLPTRIERAGKASSGVFRIPRKAAIRPYQRMSSPRDVRQSRFHHLPRRGVRSQIAPVKVRQCRRPQIIHQPFIFITVDCLPVQRQEIFMFSRFCRWLVDNIAYTVLAQCIVDIKRYSVITNYPPCYS